MRGGIEGRTKRIAAWDFAAAACALMALAVMTISSSFYALLPLILLSAVIRQRLPGGGLLELVLSLAAVSAGTLLAAEAGLRNASGLLAAVAAEVLLSGLLLMIVRLYLDRPRGGHFLTLAIGLAALTAGGAASLGWAYPALGVLYLLTGLHGLRAREHARTQPRFPTPRQMFPGALYLACSAGLAWLLVSVLPPLYGFATERFVDWVRLDPPKTGFTEGGMFLGAMEGMWESDEVVMRIDGDAFNLHLRGSVHRTYQRGQWREERSVSFSRAEPLQNADGTAAFSVQNLRDDARVLMAPLHAGVIAPAHIRMARDEFGIARVAGISVSSNYRFLTGIEALAPLPPDARDLQIPDDLQSPLAALVKSWSAKKPSDGEHVAALVRRLERDFVYAQTYQRTPGRDPVLEFLTENRLGHCEYFASGLALLARSAGIPARVVRGYRVSERNPLTGHYIVRESNAHAWVEAWIDGRWRTYDPAPLQSLEAPPRVAMSIAGALLDATRMAIGMVWQSVAENMAAAGYTIAAVLAITVLWSRTRAFRLRLGRCFSAAGADSAGKYVRPREIETLFAELAAANLQRAPSETLENFSARVAESLPESRSNPIQEQILAYIQQRYGGAMRGE